MTSYFQRPLNLGADIVVHSLTKYLNGHSDIIGGAIISSKDLLKKIETNRIETGGSLGPFQAWLTIRGIKTLPLRMEKHNKNAIEIANFLESHYCIEKMYYPGLKSHPQHKLALCQMSGFGGIISFTLKGGIKESKKLLNSVELCKLAVSLGAVETLIQHPASMTHSNVSKEKRIKMGIKDNLIRLSVGIEDNNDIINDLKQALDQI
jgi:methionine-gamma-lyase